MRGHVIPNRILTAATFSLSTASRLLVGTPLSSHRVSFVSLARRRSRVAKRVFSFFVSF